MTQGPNPQTSRPQAGLLLTTCASLALGSRIIHDVSDELWANLMVEVPAGCGIRVGGEARTWERGRALVFDDSFEHEVWNDADAERVVLLLRFWHPDLGEDKAACMEHSRAVRLSWPSGRPHGFPRC